MILKNIDKPLVVEKFNKIHQEEIEYINQTDRITISGTFTKPKGKTDKLPCVFLVAGMGPNDRDYTMLGHKLFLVLAEYLTNQGIAVLRVDKRGVGKSTGVFNSTVTSLDLARDVQAGLAYLLTRNDINPTRIGLMGHSEGGLISALVARETASVSFLILLAGAIEREVKAILEQVSMQLKADGASRELIEYDTNIRKHLIDIILTEDDYDKAANLMKQVTTDFFIRMPETLKSEAENYKFAIRESSIEHIISFFNSPAYRFWLEHDSTTDLKNLKMPILALNGDLDFITASKIQLPSIQKALELAGNQNFSIQEMAGMNHWFQECQTGAFTEYGAASETIAPKVLEITADWIKQIFCQK